MNLKPGGAILYAGGALKRTSGVARAKYSVDKKLFYPVSEGEVKVGDYTLQIEYERDGNYNIIIKYTEE